MSCPLPKLTECNVVRSCQNLTKFNQVGSFRILIKFGRVDPDLNLAKLDWVHADKNLTEFSWVDAIEICSILNILSWLVYFLKFNFKFLNIKANIVKWNWNVKYFNYSVQVYYLENEKKI